MKMKQLFGVGAVIALLLSAQPAAAQCCPPEPCCPDMCCDPCTDWCDMCGDWEVGAHALFWTPVTCAYNYAVNAPAVTPAAPFAGNVSALKCSTDWGFRVFGNYLSDCSFIGLSYQWFESKTADSRTGENLRIKGGGSGTGAGVFSGRVTARQTLEYQNLDLRWGKYLHRACGCNFYVFGNARWVDVSYRRSIRQQVLNTSDTRLVTEKSSLEGGALGVGTGADFDLWCDIGLFGEANVLGVIAERSTRNVNFVDTTPATSVSATYPSDTCINPELNFRLGLNYHYTCGCWTVVGEIGYELDYFWDAFAFPDNGPGLLNDSNFAVKCQNVGFSGLFFGGKILF